MAMKKFLQDGFDGLMPMSAQKAISCQIRLPMTVSMEVPKQTTETV